MLKKIFLFFLIGLPFLGTTANNLNKRPKIIVRIVVEQMRYEMLLRYWDEFGEDGFKKLAGQGAYFTNARLNYSSTQRSSGFATLATGSYPSVHGIIGDFWYDRLSGDLVYSIRDDKSKPVGGEKGNYSPRNLMSTTLGDELKKFDPKSKVYSVGIHPVSAIFGAGRLSDGAFWFDDKSGNWMTSTYYHDTLSSWINKFNQKNLQDIYMDRHWNKLLPDSNYTMSLPDDNDAEVGFLLLYKKSFPYNLNTLKRKSRSYKYLKYTPFGNTYTKDFALALLNEEKLGQDEHTDILNIAFSSSSFVNELFGPRSIEMEDLIVRLDKDISHLISYLTDHFDKDDFLVVLTSDRGCIDPHEYNKAHGIKTKTYKPKNGLALLRSYLNIVYKDKNWISSSVNNQLYLDHSLIDQGGFHISDFQERVSRFFVKKSGVAYAVKASTLLNTNFTKGILGKIQNSYHPKRSGDILLSLEPGTVEVPERSGSVYNYDNHIPLILFGDNIPAKTFHSEVYLKDVSPAISVLFNIPSPNASDGSKILEVLD
jgi:predicted AlkP superfamily pyrophosphatase or phosphodiesterase